LHQRHSSGGGSSVQQQQQGPVLWNATARIQVKSVNVLTGEAQPAVSASTPFSHTVQGASSKQEAKEMIASSLLAQIERARVVNAALFTVLSAANSTRLIASLPAAARITGLPDAPQQQQTEQQHYPQRQQQQPQSDSIWSAPLQSGSFGTGSHGGHPPIRLPSMDMARIAAAESNAASAAANNPANSSLSSSSSASLFSMHTPVAGRPFSGISNIGISTPHAGDATPLPAGSPASAAAAQQQQQRSPHSAAAAAAARSSDDDAALSMSLATMLRSVSEIEAEITSQGAAESALFETPRHAAR
jgi:hypothetical protein